MKSQLRAFYERRRGRELPADVPLEVIVGLAVRKGFEAARGARPRTAVRRKILFRGSRVQLRNIKQLTMGTGVVLGDDVRIDAFGRGGVHIGNEVTIGRGTSIAASGVISHPGEHVSIGDRSAVGERNVLWGQGGLTIGRNCLFGPGVTIISEDHAFEDPDVTIRAQGHRRAPIVIGDDCWLGANATILKGVTIGDGAVVGAGAVVNADVPPYAIAVGVPARIVGSRTREPSSA